MEKALVSIIQGAWIVGVSTRRVDDLEQAMGMSGISEPSVSKLCKDIDERVNAFRMKQELASIVPEISVSDSLAPAVAATSFSAAHSGAIEAAASTK